MAHTPVVYIGKAGKQGGRATLRSRLRAYLRQGRGHRAGHWGGRMVWLIADFVACFGQRPFANRRA